jgi:heme exporter protein CcmD
MESLAFGGYGVYVWSSFGLTFAVVGVTIVQARLRHSRVLRDLRVQIEAMETGQ